MHNFILGVFISLYMFRATMGPSAGDTSVFMRHLVLVFSVWVAVWYAGFHHAYQTAYSSPKHVKIDKYTKNKIVHQVGFIYKIIQRCTVNKT